MLQSCQMSKTITVRLPEDLAIWLEETASRSGTPRGRIIRDALETVRAGRGRRPSLRLVGSVHGPRDLSTRKGYSRP